MVYWIAVDARVAILTLPSLLVLGLLVAHSLRALPRSRALLFWSSVAAYGLLRGVALRLVIERLPGATFPYAMRHPVLPVLGVPLQEIAGWAIVAYMGWWLSCRFSRHLFVQIAWALLFLGAVSWTVESAAVAAGWWSWTIPVTQPLFVNVPFIAIVDWAFVGLDFLLPFLALTAPALSSHRARFLSLLAFPFHFGAHCLADRALGPVPLHHLAHWIEIGVLLWLALRSQTQDAPFATRLHWLPLLGLAIVVIDAAAVEVFLAGRPELLFSVLPTLAVALQALSPRTGYTAGAAALVLSLWAVPLLVAAIPAASAGALAWGRRHGRWTAIAAVVLSGLLAFQVHARGARRQHALTTRLDAALAARDRGDLARARQELAALAGDFPGSHVPLALLGEIDYRTERLEEARAAFARAVDIKQDDVKSYRHLAVIERRLGRPESAVRFAARGLAIAATDPELLYLAGRPVTPQDPETTQTLASLAFEVGDLPGTAALLDQGLVRWPEQRSFYPGRVNLALQAGDREGARRAVAAWLDRFPGDAEARRASAQLGIDP